MADDSTILWTREIASSSYSSGYFSSKGFESGTVTTIHRLWWTECVSPQNPYIGTPNPTMTVSGDRAFRRCLWLNDIIRLGPWSDRISILIRGDRREHSLSHPIPIFSLYSIPPPPPCENTGRNELSCKAGRTQSCWDPDLKHLIPKIMRNESVF